MCPVCQAADCWHVDTAYDLSPWAFLDSLDTLPPDPPMGAPWPLLSEWRRRRLLT
jgi:hypothetical protein